MNKKKSRAPRQKSGKQSNGAVGQPATTVKKRKILHKEVYEITMKEIDALMKKGEDHLTKAELDRLNILTEAAETYEDTYEPLPIPSSLSDMIRMKMFQLKLNQYYTAQLLGVSEAKFSLIMNGKQKPDISFVKAIHIKLSLDANQILQAI